MCLDVEVYQKLAERARIERMSVHGLIRKIVANYVNSLPEAQDLSTLPTFLSVSEVARLLRLDPKNVHNMIQGGVLKAYNVVGRYLIPRSEVFRLLGIIADQKPEPIVYIRQSTDCPSGIYIDASYFSDIPAHARARLVKIPRPKSSTGLAICIDDLFHNLITSSRAPNISPDKAKTLALIFSHYIVASMIGRASLPWTEKKKLFTYARDIFNTISDYIDAIWIEVERAGGIRQ